MAIDHAADGRRAKRKNLTLKGSFKIKDGDKYKLHLYREPVDLTLADIALMGCGFITSFYLPKGLKLAVTLKGFPVISGTNIQGTKTIEFIGKVMSCKKAPNRSNAIGIAFADIHKESLDLIKNFVESTVSL